MKKVLLNSILAVSVLMVACKKDEIPAPEPTPNPTSNLSSYFDENRTDATQTFSINPTVYNQFTGANGVIVMIPANSFVDVAGNPVSGTVTMSMIEILDQSSMIRMDMPTTSNGAILVSGGQLNLTAKQGSSPVFLASDASISVMVPTANYDSQMQLFAGVENSSGEVDWILSVDETSSTADTVMFVADSSGGSNVGYYYFNWDDPNLGWINCDYFYNDPNPLTFFSADLSDEFSGSNTSVYAHFSNINSVMPLYHASGIFGIPSYYPGVPVGSQITLVCISEISGTHYSAFVPATITANMVIPVTMNVTTVADIEAAIDNL